MKKLLLPLTFICFFVTSNMMAQNKQNNSTTKIKKAIKPKISKNNAVIRINEVPSRPSVISRSSNRNTTRKQRIVETSNSRRNSAKKVSHREMIAKRKQIVENY